jgi:hypothetical protein
MLGIIFYEQMVMGDRRNGTWQGRDIRNWGLEEKSSTWRIAYGKNKITMRSQARNDKKIT